MQIEKPIGILGGTFDPIHMGHLRMAIELYEAASLEKILIVPCYQPVHRKLPVASPLQRLIMVKEAIKNEPVLEADSREIDRKTPSYMIETLQSLRKEMPHTPLCLLMGFDAFLNFPSWNHWEAILDLAHLVVAHRPQYQIPSTGLVAELLKERLTQDKNYPHQHLAGSIFLLPITQLEISASEIRKQIAMGKNPRYLLPNSVYEYIKQEGFYNISRISS